jgi:hypothetical protein
MSSGHEQCIYKNEWQFYCLFTVRYGLIVVLCDGADAWNSCAVKAAEISGFISRCDRHKQANTMRISELRTTQR